MSLVQRDVNHVSDAAAASTERHMATHVTVCPINVVVNVMWRVLTAEGADIMLSEHGSAARMHVS